MDSKGYPLPVPGHQASPSILAVPAKIPFRTASPAVVRALPHSAPPNPCHRQTVRPITLFFAANSSVPQITNAKQKSVNERIAAAAPRPGRTAALAQVSGILSPSSRSTRYLSLLQARYWEVG